MSRDHLIPSVMVDRNGHTKTVYVAPNKSAATSPRLGFAAPSLSRFEEHDDDEWEDHDDEEADPEWENIPDRSSWEANGFPASEASDWHYLGFDSDDAYEWSNESIDATEAKEWSNSGFRSNEAREWMDEGFQDAGAASSWKFEMEGRSFSIADAYEMHDAGAESEDGAQWVRVLSEVNSFTGKGLTLTSLISTLKGVNPSAADSYMEARIPYSQWSGLAQAGIEYDMVAPLMDVKRVIEDKHHGEHDEEWSLFTAAGWVGSANNFDTQKHVFISDAIVEGKSQDDCQIFLKYSKDFPDDISIDQVLAAQKWASEAAGDGTLEATKEVLESYDRFVRVFSELDDVEDLVEKHGAKKIDEAMYQGLDTGPAIRSFLEDISVAEISRGAL